MKKNKVTKPDDFCVVISKALDEALNHIEPLVPIFRRKIAEHTKKLELAQIELDEKEAWIKNYKESICEDGVPRSAADYRRLDDNLNSLISEKEKYKKTKLKNKESVLENHKLILESITQILKNIEFLKGNKEIKKHYIHWWWRISGRVVYDGGQTNSDVTDVDYVVPF